MSEINRFMDNAKGFADFVGQKAFDAAEVSKAFARKKSIEYKINEKYKELGRLCFEMHQSGLDDTGSMKKLIGEISLLQSDLRAAEDESSRSKVCRFCGTANDVSNLFCSHCGNSM